MRGVGIRAFWYTGPHDEGAGEGNSRSCADLASERQADVAHMVELMEEQDKSELRLGDEQVEEVKRRLAEPNPKFMTLEEVRRRFARRRFARRRA